MLQRISVSATKRFTVASASTSQVRAYTDGKFGEREKASEDLFIYNLEKEKLKALKEKLEKAQKDMAEIEKNIENMSTKK